MKLMEFITTKICYISYSKYWKGIYIHFLPYKTYRIFYTSTGFHVDSRSKLLTRLADLDTLKERYKPYVENEGLKHYRNRVR